MFWLLTSLIILTGTADLLAIWLGRRSWRYLFKPGTMLLIIALAATGQPEAGPYGWWVLAGLLLSVAGDIFLVLPSDRFILGLLSFFAAHILYIAAFQAAGPVAGSTGPVALALAAVGLLYFRLLKPGVAERGGKGLLLPVFLYMTVISVMVWRAFGTGQPLLIAGALLFYLSDAILAYARFLRPHRLADLGVMSTYFAAQYLLALSTLPLG
ncbi:MAG: lysoplasmalogenase [Bacillota bacterium]